MESELDIIDSLTALGYAGKCLQNQILADALNAGTRNSDFRQLVAWLTNELHVLRKTDENVSLDTEDLNEFTMELSSLLKELGCPYEDLVAGPLSERFETLDDRMQLLEFLITELMATKMTLRLRPKTDAFVIPKIETNTARTLQQLSSDLGLGPPPENVAAKAYFDKLNFKVEEKQRAAKPGVLSDSLLRTPKPLTAAQWKKLESMHADLDAEYNLRRQMLLTRLEVTIQSFQWADKMKTRQNEIIQRFENKMQELEALKYGGDDTNIIALLAARADLAIIEKTSSANVRKNTAAKIQKHIIGSVPDRGGRAYEHAPPPPEMPSWQQQRASGPSGGRGGGGNNFRGRGGGGGGGGNWQQFSSQQQQSRPPQYEQRLPQDQTRGQNWIHGSGRVQGSGWSAQNLNNADRGNGDERGSGHFSRGRSNFQRGGGHRR